MAGQRPSSLTVSQAPTKNPGVATGAMRFGLIASRSEFRQRRHGVADLVDRAFDDAADFSKEVTCRISIDLSVTYMEAACFDSKSQPEVWRQGASDMFFFLRYAGKTEKCVFQTATGGNEMSISGCRLAGLWTAGTEVSDLVNK